MKALQVRSDELLAQLAESAREQEKMKESQGEVLISVGQTYMQVEQLRTTQVSSG